MGWNRWTATCFGLYNAFLLQALQSQLVGPVVGRRCWYYDRMCWWHVQFQWNSTDVIGIINWDSRSLQSHSVSNWLAASIQWKSCFTMKPYETYAASVSDVIHWPPTIEKDLYSVFFRLTEKAWSSDVVGFGQLCTEAWPICTMPSQEHTIRPPSVVAESCGWLKHVANIQFTKTSWLWYLAAQKESCKYNHLQVSMWSPNRAC